MVESAWHIWRTWIRSHPSSEHGPWPRPIRILPANFAPTVWSATCLSSRRHLAADRVSRWFEISSAGFGNDGSIVGRCDVCHSKKRSDEESLLPFRQKGFFYR